MAAPSEVIPAHELLAPPPLVQRLQDRREQLWLLVDLVIVAWLCWLFDAINNLAPVRQALAVRNGQRVLDFERSLHLDPEHALN
ncbi:MAG TPA: hypothetical protein VK761_07765, partial [Solirubrobacteraceae bacterium]|nr:hypothetical protein [Solirubrobacteraceae bacterium]